MPTGMTLRQVTLTDRGRQREANEDAHGATVGPQGAQLFCVADGMGGHAAGDVASRVGVDAALAAWRQGARGQSATWRLARCVREANDAVLTEAGLRGSLGNMGSTIVLLAVDGQAAYLAHAGDSRAYRLRGGQLERLTQDHSEAAERVASGELDAAEAERSAYAHVVTRGLGLDDPVVPDLAGPLSLAADDTFLLCTDGLTSVVEEEAVRDVLRYHDLEKAGQILVRLANSRGGPDNVTVQLIRVGPRTGPLEVAPVGYRVPYGSPERLIYAIAMVLILAGVALGLVLCLT